MTAKEYLGQAYRIDQRINSKMEQIAVQMGYGIDNIYKCTTNNARDCCSGNFTVKSTILQWPLCGMI